MSISRESGVAGQDRDQAGRWVVQDIPAGECFSGSCRHFKPEVPRWKAYDTNTSARKAAGHIRRFNREPRITDIQAAPFAEAKDWLRRQLDHMSKPAVTPAAAQPAGEPASAPMTASLPVPEQMTRKWVTTRRNSPPRPTNSSRKNRRWWQPDRSQTQRERDLVKHARPWAGQPAQLHESSRLKSGSGSSSIGLHPTPPIGKT